jgi:hypothetical protein
MVRRLVEIIGRFEYEAVERRGRVTLFRLAGPTGVGIMADSSEPDPDRPGVYAATVSAWVRRTASDGSWILDGRFLGWDPWADAAATGDRSLVDGPRGRMYRVRDERTAEIAREDSLVVSEVGPGELPALMAGMVPLDVLEAALLHEPDLAGLH